MKLIIQLPCFNEAQTLSVTLAALPRSVPGFDVVEWLVIDDGSQDNTVEVAKAYGVDHIIKHASNRGLAKAFMTGLEACLTLSADVIVNTDADNQYNADDIPILVKPILEYRAEMVIGTRPISTIKHFSIIKKWLHQLGSWVVRVISRTDTFDAPSGFRAITRVAAQKLVVFNSYTYTIETIIQARQKNIAITSVPIRVNDDLRPSKLIKSIPSYIRHSMVTIMRVYIIYHPFRFFGLIGGAFFGVGLLIGLQSAWKYLIREDYIQSLIFSSILLGIGVQTLLIAFIADLLSVNRRLLEDIRFKSIQLLEKKV